MREPIELPFKMVSGVGPGIGVLNGGPDILVLCGYTVPAGIPVPGPYPRVRAGPSTYFTGTSRVGYGYGGTSTGTSGYTRTFS